MSKYKLALIELTAENGMKKKLSGEYHELFGFTNDDGCEEFIKIPVSWSNIKEIYNDATDECPTVEMVDVHDLKQVISNAVYNYEQVANRKTSIHEYIYTSVDDYLTQNGYKIIKECE